MTLTAPAIVPLPRSSPEGSGDAPDAEDALRRGEPRREVQAEDALWYERVLGWPVAGGPPAQLVTGERFDVLELPADAGAAVLRRPVATGPVALMGRRMRFLVAPGSAEELPGLLDWLEWGGVPLELTALGPGGRMTAPAPPAPPAARTGLHEGTGAPAACGESPRGAAVWLRPPEPGCESLLPSLTAPGRTIGPDLARLVGAAATECHRARLAGLGRQPLAFS
ncbi:SCO3374 family protein [Streptomyces sp. NPDC051211]|uniref:SCO3374 family protein n=1 Tax=Streptomyces sp. NPDC051211 TaxID=3154643 RepID=UPI003450B321